MNTRAQLASAFVSTTEWSDSTRINIAGDASNRRYDRLTNPSGQTCILMDAAPEKGEDVRPFVRIAQHLTSNGLSAPKILHQDTINGFLLIEDLGEDIFARLMAQDPSRQLPLYLAATDLLVDLQKAPTLDLPICGADWLTEMALLVFEWYAKEDISARFRDCFAPLAETLNSEPKVVILRDYHAENLLWLPDREGSAKVGLLDFQDALLGHPAYDLVSILQDARRDVPVDIEAKMIDHFLSRTMIDRDNFLTAYAILGAQRNLRILGIFARLCLRDGKAHYVDLIPRVWDYTMRNLSHPALAQLAQLIKATLPYPTPEFLEHLKSQCAINPTP